MPLILRPILRNATFWVLCQVLSTVPYAPLAATTREDVSARQTARAIPESAARLQSQLEAILKTSKEGDSKRFEELISDLQIPESANWFAATFGEEVGQNLAATYKSSWKDYEDNIRNIFRDSGTAKHTHVFVKEFSTSSPAPNDPFIQSILRSAKGPLVLYTAGAGKDRETDSLPGAYIFAQGAFRVVNWRTFYDLPKVKPMRIRMGGQVAPQLIHRVDPISPSDALQQQVHGTVVLHVVIDLDGNVAQLEPVSGPPELIDAAVEAARQWRYKPTILNGDPVEVDTTIRIAFGEGNGAVYRKTVVLEMSWKRGDDHYGPNFIYLESACLSNPEPGCFCSHDFKITTSKEFADYVESFGSNRVPVKYHVDYDRNHQVVGATLESVGEWSEERFHINERSLSTGFRMFLPAIDSTVGEKSSWIRAPESATEIWLNNMSS